MKKLVSLVCVIAVFVFVYGRMKDKEPDAHVVPEPTFGGTLKIHSYNPDTLNPILTQNEANSNMLKIVFEPLIYVDQSGRPLPVLADYWNVSDNGVSWYIHIRENVAFHDGTPLTAYDVKESLLAAMQNEANPVYVQNLSEVLSVEATDGNYLRINILSPNTNFMNLLEIPICKAAFASEKQAFAVIGTGPYVYAGQREDNKIIDFKANLKWWGVAPPYIEHIEAVLLPDKNTVTFLYDTREIDVVATDMLSVGRYTGSTDSRVTSFASNKLTFIGFNNSRKNMSDLRVRQAVMHSIDKQKLFSQVLLSQYDLTDTFLNPNCFLYAGDLQKYDFDIAKAHQLLTEAGFEKKALSFDLIVNRENEFRCRLADFIAESLKEAKITVSVRKLVWADYQTAINNHNYDAFIGEIVMAKDLNPSFLFAKKNTFGYSSLEAEEIILRLNSQADDEGRIAAYRELQSLYLRDLPFAALFFERRAILTDEYVLGNIEPVPSNIFYNISEWYISE